MSITLVIITSDFSLPPECHSKRRVAFVMYNHPTKCLSGVLDTIAPFIQGVLSNTVRRV